MKVLLRSIPSGLYFQSLGQWTGQPQEANDFGTSAQAINYVAEERLKNLELILFFDDPRYNIRMPLFEKAFLGWSDPSKW